MTGVLPGIGAGRNVALGQWDSDPVLARALVRWAGLSSVEGVLDLSCGTGNILAAARELHPCPLLYGVEIDAERAMVCESRGIPVLTGDIMHGDIAAAVRRILDAYGRPCVALGNPPFEKNGALSHPLRWLELGLWRACWIAPLTTLASAARFAMWAGLELRRVDVCVPRPSFGTHGASGGGATEIAFFEAAALPEGYALPMAARLGWVEWRKLGAPEVSR